MHLESPCICTADPADLELLRTLICKERVLVINLCNSMDMYFPWKLTKNHPKNQWLEDAITHWNSFCFFCFRGHVDFRKVHYFRICKHFSDTTHSHVWICLPSAKCCNHVYILYQVVSSPLCFKSKRLRLTPPKCSKYKKYQNKTNMCRYRRYYTFNMLDQVTDFKKNTGKNPPSRPFYSVKAKAISTTNSQELTSIHRHSSWTTWTTKAAYS